MSASELNGALQRRGLAVERDGKDDRLPVADVLRSNGERFDPADGAGHDRGKGHRRQAPCAVRVEKRVCSRSFVQPENGAGVELQPERHQYVAFGLSVPGNQFDGEDLLIGFFGELCLSEGAQLTSRNRPAFSSAHLWA
ncbi:hypothetical protein [Bradyrhizobium elkanii]|uniref:hypothetical protein n=1 Tax=Bradyrhizobium elkanii TaxID=29448 RepID=UPI001FCAC103|nr:hypothetical protein [Bradyrhizobium elkanii]WLA85590.1 hypothetical protein QNJ99_15940 [Bradyrhizobium elkanii]